MTHNDEPPSKIAKISSNTLEVIPILDDKFTADEVPSTSFYAAIVPDRKLIGKFIKKLPPLPEKFAHLKRVAKDGRLLIAETEETAKEIVTDLGIDLQLLKIEVPVKKPFTRRQFSHAKELWPTGFHPDEALENKLSGQAWTDLLNVMLELSNRAERVGCILVKDNEEVCSGSKSSKLLGHPVMVMIENASRMKPRDDIYLGNGCDVYLADEPCQMCAMALVHFRVARVFFNKKSTNGTLDKPNWQLHLEPCINHHYEVYRLRVCDDH